MSATVLGELYYGAYASQRTADNLAALSAFVGQLQVYEFGSQPADEFGKTMAEQRAKGKPIPSADAQVAGGARLHGLTVLTDDVHFQVVDGLRADNWLV